MRFIYIHYRIPCEVKGLPKESDPALLERLCLRYYRGHGPSGHGFLHGGKHLLATLCDGIIEEEFASSCPSARGGITRCLVVDGPYDYIFARGNAYFSVRDSFCYRTGREIAKAEAKEELGKRLIKMLEEALAST